MPQTFFQYQQIVMKSLALYDGRCDGVWGPKSIEAKRAWEVTPEFEPAVPNGGMPINTGDKLPKGLRWIPGTSTMMCSFISNEELKRMLKEETLLTVDEIENKVKPKAEPQSVQLPAKVEKQAQVDKDAK